VRDVYLAEDRNEAALLLDKTVAPIRRSLEQQSGRFGAELVPQRLELSPATRPIGRALVPAMSPPSARAWCDG
jgi:hypothetical protein